MRFAPLSWLAVGLLLGGCATTMPPGRPHPALPREVWVDLVAGDEAAPADVIADLAPADVIYVGEIHTVARHHAIQLALLQELFARGVKLTLCLEQLEAPDQPAVDRYLKGEIDAATLAGAIDWPNTWRSYAAYLKLCEFARAHGIPIRAINAPAAVVRAVYRGGGVASLAPEQRAQLPAELRLDDPVYERLTNLALAVHAGLEDTKKRGMFEAQVVRDETMAANIVAARRGAGGEERTAFVVLGSGHMRYGLGVPERVRGRVPDITDRLVLMSESGALRLTAAERAGAKPVEITHADLRAVGRPVADYLRLLPLRQALPPGHPAVAD
jgi:uncharacterized iron-regulated protein